MRGGTAALCLLTLSMPAPTWISLPAVACGFVLLASLIEAGWLRVVLFAGLSGIVMGSDALEQKHFPTTLAESPAAAHPYSALLVDTGREEGQAHRVCLVLEHSGGALVETYACVSVMGPPERAGLALHWSDDETQILITSRWRSEFAHAHECLSWGRWFEASYIPSRDDVNRQAYASPNAVEPGLELSEPRTYRGDRLRYGAFDDQLDGGQLCRSFVDRN